MTYGCTKESCHFRDLAGEFAAVGAQPVGISADTVEKQKQFDEKESLGFPLLSDPDRVVAAHFGAKRSLSFLNQADHLRHRHRPHPPRRPPHRDLHGRPRRQGARRAQGATRCLSAPSSSPAPPRASAPPPPRAWAPRAGTSSASTRTTPDIVADLATRPGRRDAVAGATERSGGVLAGIVTCAGLAGLPGRAGSLLAAVNYFGTVDLLDGLRPLLRPGRRRRGHQLELDHRAARHPRRPRRGLPAPRRGASAQIADARGSLVTYPATKLAVAYWVRRQRHRTGLGRVGTPPQRHRPGHDRHADGGRHAGGPRGRTAARHVAHPGRPPRPARGDRRPGRPAAGSRRRFFCGSVLFCDGGSDALLRTNDWPAAWDISVPTSANNSPDHVAAAPAPTVG